MKARVVTEGEVGEIICDACQRKVDEAMELALLSNKESLIMSEEFSDILEQNGKDSVEQLYFCVPICFRRVEDVCRENGIPLGDNIIEPTNIFTDLYGCGKCTKNHVTGFDSKIQEITEEMAKKWLEGKEAGDGDTTEDKIEDVMKEFEELKVKLNPNGADCDCTCHKESNKLDEDIDNYEMREGFSKPGSTDET